MNIDSFIRPNIRSLKPYSSARHEFSGHAEVFLDANENPFGNAVNRYPDPLQSELKQAISKIKGIPAEQVFLGNGSDEAIDLILRIFCRPAIDEIIVLPPTYGMYQVSADIADVKVNKIGLDEYFQPQVGAVLQQTNERTKVLFLCSPNNPSGNLLDHAKIIHLIEGFNGIVVIDEAYIDFNAKATCLPLISKYDNLVVLQTLSKAWGMAAIRLGMAFSTPKIISYFNKVKAPYNINILTQKFALDRLSKESEMIAEVKIILDEKEQLIQRLSSLDEVIKVYPSDTNFLLVKVKHAEEVYKALINRGVVVRSRAKEPGCLGCLRITIGTPEENTLLTGVLRSFNSNS